MTMLRWSLLLMPGAVWAQDPATIVVTGRPLAVPPGAQAYDTVTIGRDRLVLGTSDRLETILGEVAGLQQFRRSDSRSANPTAQGVTLRGLGGTASSRALVLLDGVPQADPFFGSIPFSALVPDRLGSVRVTQGGGIGPFGAGAVAGTIELQSAARADLPRLAARADSGSNDAVDAALTWAPKLGSGTLVASARGERGDGFFTTPSDQRVPATARAAYRGGSASLRALAPLGPQVELQARALIYHDARTLRFAGADSTADGADASVRAIARGRWQVDALAYVQARDFSNVVISATTFRKTLDQRATPSTGVGGKIELRPPIDGGHTLRIGADVRLAEGTTFEDSYGAAGTITARRHAGGRAATGGLFVEDGWTAGPLTLTGGARIDRWSISDGSFVEVNAAGATTSDLRFPARRGDEVSARAGAVVRFGTVLSLHSAAYSGFRAPTLNELYRPFTVFPVTTRANATLDPERLRGAEVGIDVNPAHGVRIAATAFVNRLGNAIANVTTGPNLRERRNVDAIITRGIELSAEVRSGAVSLTASYLFSDAQVKAVATALDGLRPAQTPRNLASATVAWTPRPAATLSATVRYTGAQFEDDLNVDVLPSALTIDAALRWPLGHGFGVVARAENIGDATVVTRNAAGSMDLGAPRTLWIGVSFAR